MSEEDTQFRAPCASDKGDVIFGDEVNGLFRLNVCQGCEESCVDLDKHARRLAKRLLEWAGTP